ncbi:MAG: hypothetical protein IPI17_07375 [Nitrosomonas sp.]|nr:hypothetical protein [Nitrosomonas sp.]
MMESNEPGSLITPCTSPEPKNPVLVPFRMGVPEPQYPGPKLSITIGTPKSTVLPFQLTKPMYGSTTVCENVIVTVPVVY